MEKRIKEIIGSLTLEEKVSLLSGVGLWQTREIPGKVPTVWMADGSNGVRIMKPVEGKRAQKTSDFLKVTDLTQDSPSIGTQYPAVCFPSGSSLAATWNPELVCRMAAAMGDECRYFKVNLLLAPAINIKRSPLGGRGYEYYSEDPYLTGKIAEGFINGVQSTGTGTSIKHFAANNSETLRINMSSDVDERALREIYLKPFKIAIKGVKPWTVMSSYNPVNGVQMAENKYLLTDVLRDEWGFDGIVVSDWGGVKDRIEALIAGNDLDMPENQRNNRTVLDAVKSGKLDEAVLDKVVGRLIAFALKAKENENFTDSVDFEAHRKISNEVAEESIVLLKNEDDVLPLTRKKYGKIAVLGRFAEQPRYQGGGCTLVNPIRISTPLDEIRKIAGEEGIEVSYAAGYSLKSATTEEMLSEAADAAKNADAAVIFAGLWTAYDREGFDRKHLKMDESHVRLINKVAEVQKNVIVVLSTGDAVEMPWIGDAKAVIEQFLPGETVGEAIADILFGKANPSGKLPVTFPKRLEDTSDSLYFPGEARHHVYGDGIFVGYRYYEKKKIEPLFPFGFGLSYTDFRYSYLRTDKKAYKDGEKIIVSVDVENTGDCDGKETVQFYVTDPASSMVRPEKELKAFSKIFLKKGEKKTVSIELSDEDLSYYDPEASAWVAESGEFLILAASSASDIRQRVSISFEQTHPKYKKLYFDSQHTAVFANPRAKKLYLDFLVKKNVIPADEVDAMVPLLKGNYMGIYNVITSLLGGDVTREELQAVLDEINSGL